MRKNKAYYEFLPIYNVSVFYCSDIKAVLKLAKEYIKDKDANYEHIDPDSIDYGFVAAITDSVDADFYHAYVMYVKDNQGVGTITHEATHLTNYIFDRIGQPLSLCADEVQAYLSGYFADQFNHHIRGIKTKTGELTRKRK